MQAFTVIQPATDVPTLYETPEVTANVVLRLVAGNLVYIEESSSFNAEAPDGWQHVEFRPFPGAGGDPGWIQTDFIGDAHKFEVPPIDEVEFVQRCGRAEIQANAGGDEQEPAILADYLIALAWIESELKKFGNRLPGTSSIGPYQITQEEWTEFLTANPNSGYAPFQRYQALAQVVGAEFLAKRDWHLLEALAAANGIGDPGQSYVPSFLLLFQSRIIGADAAFALNQTHSAGDPHLPVAQTLEAFYTDPTELGALIARRKRYLRQAPAGDDTTVDEFIEKTANVLTDAFKVGFSKLKEHFPEFAIPPEPMQEDWLATAQAERIFWDDASVTEQSASGQEKIRQYFLATSYHPDTVKPWCGAFVAWCLAQNGVSVLRDGAAAKNWKSWGTTELRKGGLSDPVVAASLPGAVVVLHPGEGTGTTGHVCFALNRMETSNKLKCIGGNQSDTVRINQYDLSRVASIRVMTKVESPDGDAQIVLARTIYGEARSESTVGREAVAEVILNRSASGKHSNNVVEVCLQPWQFSCWNANDPNRKLILKLEPGTGDANFDSCFAIAGAQLNARTNHLTDEVLHYYADYISTPNWVRKSPNAVMERKIGRHLFYRGIA